MIFQILQFIQTTAIVIFIVVGIVLMSNTINRLDEFALTLESQERSAAVHFRTQDDRLARTIGILESGAVCAAPTMNITTGNRKIIEVHDSTVNSGSITR